MILTTLLLSSMTLSSVHPPMNAQSALAPFPLYFTPLGESKVDIEEVDGVKYIIVWNKEKNFATWMKLDDYIKLHRKKDWIFRISIGVMIVIWIYIIWRLIN